MPLSAHLWQSPAHRVRTMLSGAFVDTNSHATDNSRTAVNSHSARTVCNTCMRDCVTVRSMVNIARLTIWSIYCCRGGGEGRADPLIVAPLRSTVVTLHSYSSGNKSIGVR